MDAILKKLCHDCLTQNDGKSYDPIRCGGALFTVPAIGVFLWGTVWSTMANHRFDFNGFAIGFGAICTGIALLAAGINIKARTDIIGDPDFNHPHGDGNEH